MPSIEIEDFVLHKSYLDRTAQEAMVADVRAVVAVAPLVAPVTPWGKPMRVRMTAAGRFGWVADGRGYRYQEHHPAGGVWPPIPDSVLAVWTAVAACARAPECCLVNFYGTGARMGLHQDKDEADFSCPVVSISLGDPALFRIGGTQRSDPTRSVKLESGDVLVMGGPARRKFHGIDRIQFGGSTLLDHGGRLNLTLRVVT
ncbi:MAG: alpha-ketoglutarate-dependent dioxygenase AlkB [Pseudomonadota bacterium]